MHEREIQTRPKRAARGKTRGPARGTLAGEVLYLQQTAGNEAVAALLHRTAVQRTSDRLTLQRDGAPEHDPLQEETVMRIVQRRVTGLAQGGQVKAYVAGVKQAKGTWATLKTPAARAQMLGKIANDRLQAAGVFSVAIRIDPTLSPQTSGQFDFTTWSIALNGGLVNQAALTDAQLKSVAGTIYHEARHAEQWFRIARWLAGQGKKAGDIATEMQIAPAAAKAAVASACCAFTQACFNRTTVTRCARTAAVRTFPCSTSAWPVACSCALTARLVCASALSFWRRVCRAA